jgi:penicillin amidase
MGLPPQNFVVGDSSGNIGWTIAGRIPKKSGFDAMVPADWSKQAGWTGWREPSEYPRIMNPPTGRIWTANARVADGRALVIIGDGGYDLAARARQIRDGLLASDEFTAEDMLAIQLDDRALFLGRWRELLLELLDDEALNDDEDLIEFRRLVEGWLPRASPDSTGYRLVRDFRTEVLGQVWAGLMLPVQAAYAEPVDTLINSQFEGPLWQLLQEQPAHLLPANYASWDALLLDAVRTNIASYDDHYDSPLANRTWGESNTAEIRHPLSTGLHFFSTWLDMPAVPQYGDSNMPRAQGRDWGASERFSVAPGDEQNGLMQMPGGQSGHPLSAYYRSEHDDWQTGQPRPFMPGAAAHRLSLLPIHDTMDVRSQH